MQSGTSKRQSTRQSCLGPCPRVPEKRSLEGAHSVAVTGGAEMLVGGSAVSCRPGALAHLGFLSVGGRSKRSRMCPCPQLTSQSSGKPVSSGEGTSSVKKVPRKHPEKDAELSRVQAILKKRPCFGRGGPHPRHGGRTLWSPHPLPQSPLGVPSAPPDF